MKIIEYYLNVFHYCFFKIQNKFIVIQQKYSLANLIYRIPFFKRKYKEKNIDIKKITIDFLTNKNYGYSIMVSGGLLISVLAFLFWSILNIIMGIPEVIKVDSPQLIVSSILALGISYKFVLGENKYLFYFKKFDEEFTKRQKVNYAVLSVVCFLGSFSLVLLSIKYQHS